MERGDMKGIVIHYENGLRRAMEGRTNGGALSVQPIMAIAPTGGVIRIRPLSFVFYEGGKVIAKSSRVLLMKGRRYPDVEHWFVLPEIMVNVVPVNADHASAVP